MKIMIWATIFSFSLSATHMVVKDRFGDTYLLLGFFVWAGFRVVERRMFFFFFFFFFCLNHLASFFSAQLYYHGFFCTFGSVSLLLFGCESTVICVK
jgi:hypothetical protein